MFTVIKKEISLKPVEYFDSSFDFKLNVDE